MFRNFYGYACMYELRELLLYISKLEVHLHGSLNDWPESLRKYFLSVWVARFSKPEELWPKETNWPTSSISRTFIPQSISITAISKEAYSAYDRRVRDFFSRQTKRMLSRIRYPCRPAGRSLRFHWCISSVCDLSSAHRSP